MLFVCGKIKINRYFVLFCFCFLVGAVRRFLFSLGLKHIVFQQLHFEDYLFLAFEEFNGMIGN